MKLDAYCSSGSSPPATNSNRSPLYVVNLHTIDALVPVIEQAVEHGTYEANELRFIAVAERAKLNFAEWSLQNLEPLLSDSLLHPTIVELRFAQPRACSLA